jgi:acyl-CoA dehydrogenase
VVATWRKNHVVDREMWNTAGRAGLLGLTTFRGIRRGRRRLSPRGRADGAVGPEGRRRLRHQPAQRHRHAPYILQYGTEEQKQRWLPRLCTGELVGAIAMTEPGAGSDLQGVKTTAKPVGNQYVINGSKTFITNGQTANLIIVVAKTDPTAGARGTSLIVVETDGTEGFERGRNLDKLGHEAQDTSELFFNDVKVPTENLLGSTRARASSS